ncbi:MAG: imidazolonepropionase [Candidatus Cloacimonetes bacterium 4572_55]|nr:MAG: imidazolonepropionase [Candidatus Cloacimonetes bacterium 4572_55]
MDADFLLIHADQLATADDGEPGPADHADRLNNLGIIDGGALAALDGKIIAVGKTTDILDQVTISKWTRVINASGSMVLPGFVDPHTHLVFAGSREDEFELRAQGKSYRELSVDGGIRSTVRRLRQTSEHQLLGSALQRLDRLIAYGTTTLEAKSGYGLSTESELKMLRIIQRVGEISGLDVIPTFLGAHEVPDEYRNDPDAYVELVINEMIPAVTKENLARFCDIFCESHVFNVDQSRRILQAAKDAGMGLKLHADELTSIGGAELAAEMGAVSADHLVAVSDHGIERMAQEGVIPVLLPGTTFSLGIKDYVPARKMIDAGLPVALATDLNPGSCYTESMQIVITLATLMLKMTAAEAITAATRNSAYAIGEGKNCGSLTVGKNADMIICDIPSYKYLPYHFGVNHVSIVIKNGKIIHAN